MDKKAKILVIGHNDIIEKSLSTYFQKNNYSNTFASSGLSLDIFSQSFISHFFEKERPEYVFLASSRSGGIAANQKFAAEFIYSNLESQNNIIHAAYKYGVKKLIFFASSCIYPKECSQPIKEEFLLTGPLESTSEPYSVAKIAGIKLCQAYKKQYGFNAIVAVPATIYGPGSDADMETAHVIGALIGKFAKAVAAKEEEVVVWGTGKPHREFIFADDFVDASLFLTEKYNDNELINIGCGNDVSIRELASVIQEISGFKGKVNFDKTKPDGTMRKLLDNGRITKLGWKARISLKEGVEKTYHWFLKNHTENRR